MPDDDPPIRTDKFGRKYPLRGRNGGGKGGGTATTIAAGTALAIWLANTGTGGIGGSIGGTAGSSAMSTVESTVMRQMGKNLTKAQRTAKRGNPKKAWRELGLRRGRKEQRVNRSSAECAALSYGEVQQFLGENGCRGLNRWQAPLSYEDGSMSVLVSRVRLRSTRDAGEFKRLIDRHGTGDVRPVLPEPHFTGHHYDSRRAGRTVFVAETEPTAPGVPDELLGTTAETAIALSHAVRR